MAKPRARGAVIIGGILAISTSFLLSPPTWAEEPCVVPAAPAVPAEAACGVSPAGPPGGGELARADLQVQTAGAEFPLTRPALEPARTGSGSRALIYTLIALCVGLVGALLAGAAGAAGLGGGRRFTGRGADRQNALLHERDQEAREQDDAVRGELKPR